jgi:Glycosyltransferase family 87
MVTLTVSSASQLFLAAMTLSRIRAYATVMAIVLWAVLAVDYSTSGASDRFGKVKGTDFLQFYVAGSFVREGRSALLYDFDTVNAKGRAVAPSNRDTVYVPIQSPQTALVFAPVTVWSYPVALTFWLIVIAVLYAIACRMMWSCCPALHAYRYETIACCVAFPGLYSTVLHGQSSCVALVVVCAAVLALRRDSRFAAGLALGCLVFKPHWVLAAGAVFLAAREWRVLAGISVSAAAQTGLTYAIAGPAVMTAYVKMLRAIASVGDLLEPRPGYSLKSFFAVFVPWPMAASALYALAALLTLAAAARIWRSGAHINRRASVVVLAMLLISPHVFEYDLILLAPVYFLLTNALAASAIEEGVPVIVWGLCALFVAPLMTGIPPAIRLQFSVTAMVAILFVLWRLEVTEGAEEMGQASPRRNEDAEINLALSPHARGRSF